MAEWLDRQQLTSRRLRWLVNYDCRDDYGATLEDTSAWAALFYCSSRKRKPHAESQPYMTWPEGNGFVVKHLYRAAKDACGSARRWPNWCRTTAALTRSRWTTMARCAASTRTR